MRMRGLLIAAVVLAALAGGLWWSNKSEDAKAKNPSPAADAPPKILSVPADQFQKIDIRKAGGEALSLERKPIKWEMTAPKPLPADQVAMESMVTTLASLASDRVVEEKAADLSQFGLAKPSMELTVTKKDGKSQQVAIGDETPTGGSYYAALKGDPRVFTVASFVKSAVDKTPNDLRDKRLLTFDVSKLTRVELAAKGPADLRSTFQMAATVLIRTVGGASGPLYGTFFLRAGAACGCNATATWAESTLCGRNSVGENASRSQSTSRSGPRRNWQALFPTCSASVTTWRWWKSSACVARTSHIPK